MKKFLMLLTLGFSTLAGFGAFVKRNIVEPGREAKAISLNSVGGDGIGPHVVVSKAGGYE